VTVLDVVAGEGAGVVAGGGAGGGAVVAGGATVVAVFVVARAVVGVLVVVPAGAGVDEYPYEPLYWYWPRHEVQTGWVRGAGNGTSGRLPIAVSM
jgi:hypothetical protein